MRRKAFFQAVPDMAWFFVLVMILVVSFVAFNFQKNQIEDELSGRAIRWETSWLANAIMTHPFESLDGKSISSMANTEISRGQAEDLRTEIRDYLNIFSKTFEDGTPSIIDTFGLVMVQDENVVIDFQVVDDREFTDIFISGNKMTLQNQTAYFESESLHPRGIAKVAGTYPITVFVTVAIG